MRYLIGLAAAFVVMFTLPTPPAEACSVRGQYCSYPPWASNAFEGRKGRVPNPYDLTNVPPSEARNARAAKLRR